MRKQFLKTALMAVAGISLLAGSALAASITGGIGMSGTWKPVDINGDITTIPLATGVDFKGYVQGPGDDAFRVISATGIFDGLVAIDSVGVIKDFQFNPYEANHPLWTVGGFTFEMATVVSGISAGDDPVLFLYGTGTMTGNDYDPTPGVWNFSGQDIGDANFTWSASTGSVAPIPEPATMLLFGTGLMGLAAVGRRKRVS